jgi:transcription elongation factor GreB
MSKAFTRESDDSSEQALPPRPKSPLPPGAKNYVTPNGARALREELEQLLALEQQRLAEATDVSQVRLGLQKARERVEYLEQSLQSAVIVPPPGPPWDQVRFGATVTVRDRNGHEARYRIVGVDEIDLDRDWVSWLSPIARALTNARIGQRVRFRAPGGEQELEVLEIVYA